ncbi:MAG: GIY-YIG nuclease family protein [Magnetococcus sp. DMHC-1]
MRVGKGIYTLKDSLDSHIKKSSNPRSDEEESNSIIRCFGMYWQRDLVVWRNDPKIFGSQPAASKHVDFGKQKGIYILYDHHTVLYVGRSVDRSLGKRLHEHTHDRLNSRWNRFSWFGLLGVTDEGDLLETNPDTSLANLIATFEAVLIEAIEPPQNRKRGDGMSAIGEYIQSIDPELKRVETQNILRDIAQRL